MSGAPPRNRLPRAHRIRRREEFLSLQRTGRRRTGPRFVVIVSGRRALISRLGITTSRKAGGAVERNRIRRLVREFFRRHKGMIAPPQDVVVIARPGAASVSYPEVVQELGSALRIDGTQPNLRP